MPRPISTVPFAEYQCLRRTEQSGVLFKVENKVTRGPARFACNVVACALSGLVQSARSLSLRRNWECAQLGACGCWHLPPRPQTFESGALEIRRRLIWARAVRPCRLVAWSPALHVCPRQRSMEHCLGCVARLVRILLGTDSLASNKLEYGSELVVLGVRVGPRTSGLRCWPSQCKVMSCGSFCTAHLLRARAG